MGNAHRIMKVGKGEKTWDVARDVFQTQIGKRSYSFWENKNKTNKNERRTKGSGQMGQGNACQVCLGEGTDCAKAWVLRGVCVCVCVCVCEKQMHWM